MKKMILAMILFALFGFTALSQIPAAIASPVQQKIKVIHPDEGRILAIAVMRYGFGEYPFGEDESVMQKHREGQLGFL